MARGKKTSPESKSNPRPAPITYSVHPGVAMVMKWVAELKVKTGRNLEEWCQLIEEKGPEGVPARREWLKSKYELGTNTAGWLAERAGGQPTWDESPESYLAIAPVYVDEIFSGARAALRPLFEALVQLSREVAGDIKICPCKTMIPFYRQHVIASVKAPTRSRLDFGFALAAQTPFTSRLKDTGGLKKKDRITHKVEITRLEDIDAAVKNWLKLAYDRDA